MGKILCIILFTFCTTIINAKCLKGNCNSGSGTMILHDGAKYTGSFKGSLPHGKGIMKYRNGNKYLGRWEYGKRHGKGKLIIKNQGEYIGSFTKGNIEGYGQFYYYNGDSYQGYFRNGKYHGTGSYTYADGKILQGSWNDDQYLSNNNSIADIASANKPTNSPQASNPQYSSQSKPKPIPSRSNSAYEPAYSKEVKIWAVIVGVAAYNHMPSLRYTDDDAYKIYAFLKSPEGGAIPDEQINVLIDDSATKKSILESMENLFSKADKNDMVMLYFSGHGLAGSFIPHDFDGSKNRILHKEIEDIFQKSQAKHKVCYADACYSGSYEVGARSINRSITNFYDKLENTSSSTALMMSSRKNEISLEFLGLKQGVFSHFLIKGLGGEADNNKDKIVTMDELFGFVKEGVRNYTGYTQTPVLMGRYHENMPVSMVR